MKRLAALIALAFVILIGWAAPNLRGAWLDADIGRLLPPRFDGQARAAALARIAQGFERRYVVLLESADEAALAQMAAAANAAARASGLAIPAAADSADAAKLARYYFDRRDRLLPAAAIAEIEAGRTAALKDAALARIFSPAGTIYAPTLAADPFVLFPSFIQHVGSGGGGFAPRAGLLYRATDQGGAVLLDWRLTASPFRLDFQARMKRLIATLRHQAAARQVKVTTAGVLDHAVRGADSGQAEIQAFSTASLILIFLMVLYAFRRPAALGQIAIVLLASLAAGFFATIGAFGRIHVIALAASTSLIGSAVDYGIHFLSRRFQNGDQDKEWHPQAAAAAIFRPMSWGMITSEIGLAGLFLTGFPVLQQIAVFSGAGLFAAYGVSLVWLPLLVRRAPGRLPGTLIATADILFRAPSPPRWTPLLALGLGLGLGVWGARASLGPDDIRSLQQPAPAIAAAEAHVATLVERDYGPQFLLVLGRDAEEVLTREAALAPALAALTRDKAIDGALTLADFAPPARDQARSLAAARNLYSPDDPAWRDLSASLGLGTERRAADPPLRLDEILPLLPAALRDVLWLGRVGGNDAGVILLKAPKAVERLRALAGPGIYWVDHVSDLSAALTAFKVKAAWFVAGAYGLMFLLFMALFGRERALALMAPAILAGGGVMGGFAALGLGIDLFALIALMLVLGFGVDYALYVHFDGERSDSATNVAILLSALSTQLAFGVLAFSHVPALRNFGLCVSCGMLIAYLAAPLARVRPRPEAKS